MTGIAQPRPPSPLASPDAFVGDRTPHLFAAILLGAALVLGTFSRLGDADPAHPLSGAPVEGVVAPTLTLPAQATARIGLVGAPTRVLAGVADSDPVPLGPPSVPRRAAVSFTLSLPTEAATEVVVTSRFLTLSGRLRDGPRLTYALTPAGDGSAVVDANVPDLLRRDRPGIYRVAVTWEGSVLAETDLALATRQPSGVSLFAEPARVIIGPGPRTAVRFDARGEVNRELTREVNRRAHGEAVAYARFGGVPYVLVISGPFAKHWLPLGDGVRLR